MPQVTINEIDQSRYLSVATRAPLIALTPVISSFGPTDKAVLVETESQYDSIFGPVLPTPVPHDITRNYAITLINSGVTLLAKRIEPIVMITKNDGTNVTAEINSSYNVTDITSKTTYSDTELSNSQVVFTAKAFGSRGNDTAFTFSKITLNPGPIDTDEPKTIYRINTYMVGSHNVSADPDTGLYIGTFNGKENSMSDYVGVDSVTISTKPSDDNYIGNTTYLNSQLSDMNVDIVLGSGIVPNETNYTKLLDDLCSLTNESQAILLVGGADYYSTVSKYVGSETYTSGTALVNTPVVPTTFIAKVTETASITDEAVTTPTTETSKLAHDKLCNEGLSGKITIDDPEATYNITAVVNDGVATLSCTDVPTFSGTITLATGAISLENVPAGGAITISYTYCTGNNYVVKESGIVTEGVATLVCKDLPSLTGTLKYEDGTITLTGIPTGSEATMSYCYTESADVDASNITNQFVAAISYRYPNTNQYPKTFNKFWEEFADHYVYDFDVITDGGFTGLADTFDKDTTSTSDLHLNMLRLAINRGDAVALLDTPQVWDYEAVYNYTQKSGGYQPQYSYGAVHAPWCRMRDLSTGNYAMMPASLAFLGAIANGLVVNGESSLWYAPAGVARASCPNVISAQYEIGGTILNYWQNTQIARVNPIMKILSYGYCVYGNATLMQNMRGYTKSSLQSLGTRFLCNAIKKAIFSLCVRLTFEPNDYNLWSTFRTELGDVLRQYQLNGVISQYEIVMDDSTVTDEDKQNLTVPGKVNIVPTLPAEYFDIDFTISAQGVTFAEQVLSEEV